MKPRPAPPADAPPISGRDRLALTRAATLAGTAAVWIGADWRVVAANDPALALLGRPRGDVLGRRYLDLLPRQAGRPAHDRLLRAMTDRRRDVFEAYAPDVGRWVQRQGFPTDGGGLLVLVRDVTERYRADAGTLRALAAVGEALPDAVVVADADRRPRFVNAAARRLSSEPAAAEVLVGTPSPAARRLLPALVADPAAFTAATEALYAGGEPGARTDVALADGRTLARDYTPVRLGSDGRPGHVWVYRDVSGVRERERRGERQRAFLARVADAVPDALYLYDVGVGTYEILNQADPSGAADRLRALRPAAARPAELAALDDDAVRTERCRVGGAGAPERWLEVREGAFARGADGRVSTAIGLLRDVTAQTAAEDALRAERAFVEKLLRGVPDIVYVIDLVRSANVWANRELTAVLGYTQEDLHAMGPGIEAALIHPGDLAKLPPFYAEIDGLPDGAFATVEYRVRHEDGSWRWLLVRQSALDRDGDGRPLTALGVAQDVTVQREAREALAAWGRRQDRVAQALQRPLLSAPPATGGASVDVASLYRPARDEAEVGGDLFDVVDVGAGRTALVVGDVMGKGLQAAASTAQVKFMLRALLLEGHGPAEALARLNGYLLRDGAGLGRDLFVTVSVAVLDPAERAVRFAVAGAEPPLVVRGSTSAVVRVSAGGVPLAFLPAWERDGEDACLALAPGDLVVLYTDGLTEAHEPDGPMFGVEGVEAALAAVDPSRPLAEVAEAVDACALAFAGGRRSDDVCLLVGRLSG